MSSTFDAVADIISDIADIERDKITPQSNVINDLEIDSLDFLDVAFEIDKKFDIKVPVEDWMNEINEGASDADEFFVMEKLCAKIDELRSENAA
jgi:acyl carrier protein